MQRLTRIACVFTCLLVGGIAHAQLTGTVVVTTNVSGATCNVASQSKTSKTSTIRFTGVPAGQHRVRCTKAGHRAFAKGVTVVGGQTVSLKAVLTRKTPAAPEAAAEADDLIGGRSKVAQPAAEAVGRARGPRRPMKRPMSRRPRMAKRKSSYRRPPPRPAPRRVMIAADAAPRPEASREGYDKTGENPYKSATREPLSTFSIDVDSASYANVRRFMFFRYAQSLRAAD